MCCVEDMEHCWDGASESRNKERPPSPNVVRFALLYTSFTALVGFVSLFESASSIRTLVIILFHRY